MEVDAPRHPMGAIQSDEQLMAVTKERNKLRDQVGPHFQIPQYFSACSASALGVSHNKLDVPQLELYFSCLPFGFPVPPYGLLVRPESQTSISSWGMSSLFCNTSTTHGALCEVHCWSQGIARFSGVLACALLVLSRTLEFHDALPMA